MKVERKQCYVAECCGNTEKQDKQKTPRTKPQKDVREETRKQPYKTLYKEIQPYTDCSNIFSVLSVLTRQCQPLIHILFNEQNSTVRKLTILRLRYS